MSTYVFDNAFGVGAGWRCWEIGGGGGSMLIAGKRDASPSRSTNPER